MQTHKLVNLISLLFFLFIPHILSAANINKVDLTDAQWEYRWGDSFPDKTQGDWRSISFPSNPPNREGKTNVWYRVKLPEILPDAPMFYVYSIDLIAEVYYNNTMIYSFGTFDAHGQGKFEGWPWHMFSIPDSSKGEYLYFRIYSDYPDIGLWGEISIASEGQLLKDMLDNDILKLAASGVTLLVGFLLLVGAFYKRASIELFFVGSLFYTQGLDLLLSTKIIQLYFNAPLMKQYIMAFAYFYVPVGVAGFLEQFVGKKFYNITRRVWQFNLLFIFFAFNAALIGWTSVSSLYIYYDYLNYTFTYPILTLLMLYLLIKGKKDEKIVAGGLLILLASWTYSSLIAWGIVPWQEHFNYIHTFSALILFTYVVMRRLSYAQELELANEKLKSAQDELVKLAIYDKLTGLYNRNKIDEYFKHEITYSKRYKDSFGVMILDIDDFKKVNDNHGHLSGDKILIEFAQVLKEQIRNSDILGRWGGEEFVVICHKLDEKQLIALAEKIRSTIQNHEFSIVGNLTASIGLSIYKEDDSEQTVFDRADQALLCAKQECKNRVSFKSE